MFVGWLDGDAKVVEDKSKNLTDYAGTEAMNTELTGHHERSVTCHAVDFLIML